MGQVFSSWLRLTIDNMFFSTLAIILTISQVKGWVLEDWCWGGGDIQVSCTIGGSLLPNSPQRRELDQQCNISTSVHYYDDSVDYYDPNYSNYHYENKAGFTPNESALRAHMDKCPAVDQFCRKYSTIAKTTLLEAASKCDNVYTLEDLKTIKFIGARVDADWCLSSQVLGKWRTTGINMVELFEQSWK